MKIVKFENGRHAIQNDGGRFLDLVLLMRNWSIFFLGQQDSNFENCLGSRRKCEKIAKEYLNWERKQSELKAKHDAIRTMKIIETIDV